MKVKKSQAAFEFLMIFGIAFSIILIIAGFFMDFSSSESNKLDRNYLDKVFNEVTAEITKVYFSGVGNRIQLNLNFPNKIKNITLHRKTNTDSQGKKITFSYINISIGENSDTESNLIELIYLLDEVNINLVCDINCENITKTDEIIYYYNSKEYFLEGRKKLQIESLEDDKVSLNILLKRDEY